MYLIIHYSGLRPYISGFFRAQAAAAAYLASFDGGHRAVLQEFELLADEPYPLYLFEASRQAFALYGAADITAMLVALPRQPSDDWCYGNVYQLNHDWQPRRAGRDEMGLLPHIHIHNHDLDTIQDVDISTRFSPINTIV
jgi:hypothetical protein